ncbi:restriction endonuclease subunit S [Providencia sp. PROV236]|uniref:restriction endonuclease subunit S n=1 Tax=Providencia sp. PROV236 TaxID=2936798 RepID=UPI0034E1A285
MVPNGWVLKNLGRLATKIGSGVTPKGGSNAYKPSGIPLIRSQNVLWGNLDLSDVAFIDEDQHAKMKGSIVYKNDVLLNITGASIGRSAVSHLNEANVNQHVCIIRSDALEPEYLKNFLLSFYGQKQIEQFQAGGNRQGLNFEQIKSFKLPVPPLPEQRKIAKILCTWDKAIATTEKLIATSQQQKKALMQQLLTGKKRLVDPDTGKVFEGEWELTHLKSLLIEEKSRNKDNKITRVLSVTNHSGFVLPEDQFSKRVASENISNYKIVKQGQFGYNPSRLNVGSFACLNQFSEGVLSPMYVVFSTNDSKLQRDYLSYWMDSHEAKQRIKNSTQGSVRESVGFDALCSFPFILPALNEQQKIASVLTAADKEIELLQAKLAHLKDEKKALMQQLLTGKRRVKVDENVAA